MQRHSHLAARHNTRRISLLKRFLTLVRREAEDMVDLAKKTALFSLLLVIAAVPLVAMLLMGASHWLQSATQWADWQSEFLVAGGFFVICTGAAAIGRKILVKTEAAIEDRVEAIQEVGQQQKTQIEHMLHVVSPQYQFNHRPALFSCAMFGIGIFLGTRGLRTTRPKSSLKSQHLRRLPQYSASPALQGNP